MIRIINGQPVEMTGDEIAAHIAAQDTPEQIEERAWVSLRAERDARLAACDWTQLPDVDPSPSAESWTSYRQLLRDLPENTTDPYEPEWPTEPAEI